MDVSQVIGLASWYLKYIPEVVGKYQQLQQVLEHNATQPQKNPVREHLEALIETLEDTTFEQLTNEEVSKLEELEVFQYLGSQGVRFVKEIVKSGDFDPASAARDIKDAFNALNDPRKPFQQVNKLLIQLKFQEMFEREDESQSLIRVRFQEGAAISDVALWKKWSTDWHDIVRGIAMCAGENPNDVRVIGASNGSIVMTLAGTVTVTLILASIVKNVGKIVHEILKISNAIEDLRHKRYLNRTIETELQKQQKELRDNGVQKTIDAVKAEHPDLVRGEVEAGLKKSVEKYLKFNNKGGDVDFIPPKNLSIEDETDEEGSDNGLEVIAIELRKLREDIDDIRITQSEIRLLGLHHDGFE